MRKTIVLIINSTVLSVLLLIILSGYLAFNFRDSYNRLRYGVSEGVCLENIPLQNMLEDEVTRLLEDLNRERFQRPRNAYLDSASGEILPEVSGRKIDVHVTGKLIMNAEPYETVFPVYIMLDPEITADVYRNINSRLGSFRTWYGGGGRGVNIRLAANSLNYYLIAPGEVFSFNAATGPRVPERGYRMAPIIVGGAVVPGYGGGVCQVSTTLYNAVLNAGLEVVERFPHSRPVDYVPRGRDATVSNYLDFKFRNNTDRFKMIWASSYGACLEISIWE